VRTVIAGQTISMISASACKIYLSYFSWLEIWDESF
jgi:hypothetical protein